MLGNDRSGCRSLVCDPNGFIIAEMVHRCMICAHISESVVEAKRHYQENHFESSDRDPSSPINYEDELFQSNSDDDPEDEDVFQELDEEEGNAPSSSAEQLSSSSPVDEMESPVTDPSDHMSRGGSVVCSVCSMTKVYACVQRRFGQYTCMGCAKFFGRFLVKPRQFYCINLGSCPLDVSPRCKACLLQACASTYIIEDNRKEILDTFRPLKQSPPPSESSNQSGLTRPASLVANALLKRTSQLRKAALENSVQSRSRNSPGSSRASPSYRKQWGCRRCSGCLIADCGKCNYCLDKPKFGGPNTLKKKCIRRKCLGLPTSSQSTQISISN